MIPAEQQALYRIAAALERIARCLESQTYGSTAEEVAAVRALLEDDLRRQRGEGRSGQE